MLPLCGIYNTVHGVVFLLGIVLIILGGALYAGANVMPSQSKGPMQGYGMGFVLGGVAGVIIAMLAPYLISLVSGQSSSAILKNC
jgi:drug/metabolite transporter (DMT)-like permease